jgi:hypothetical protein
MRDRERPALTAATGTDVARGRVDTLAGAASAHGKYEVDVVGLVLEQHRMHGVGEHRAVGEVEADAEPVGVAEMYIDVAPAVRASAVTSVHSAWATPNRRCGRLTCSHASHAIGGSKHDVCGVGFPDLTSFMGPDVASVVLEQKAALGSLECLVRCVG